MRPLSAPPNIYGNPEHVERSEALLAALADAPEPTAADGSPLVRCTYRRDGLQCHNNAEASEGGYRVAGKPVCFSCSLAAQAARIERSRRGDARAAGAPGDERVYAPTPGLARYARGWR